MHISEGILNGPVVLATMIVAAVVTGITLKKVHQHNIPKISVMTAAFFVVSLIHFKVGPTSMHLVLNGLTGIVLGVAAFPAIVVGLLFQAVMFGHGGMNSLGANALVLGLPALLAGWIFRATGGGTGAVRFLVVRSGGCAALAVALSGILLTLVLQVNGGEFFVLARVALLAHIPLMVIEAILSAVIINFFHKARPQIFTDDI